MAKQEKQQQSKSAKQKIRIRLKGYDQRLLDRSVADIVENSKKNRGCDCRTHSFANKY